MLERMNLPFGIGSGRTFVDDPSKLRLDLWLDREHSKVTGTVWMGPSCIGPPGRVHGGASCYVLDEAMGCVCFAMGYQAFARRVSFELVRMVPLETDLTIHAYIEDPPAADRTIIVSGMLALDGLGPLVISRGEFRMISQSHLERLTQTKEAILSLLPDHDSSEIGLRLDDDTQGIK